MIKILKHLWFVILKSFTLLPLIHLCSCTSTTLPDHVLRFRICTMMLIRIHNVRKGQTVDIHLHFSMSSLLLIVPDKLHCVCFLFPTSLGIRKSFLYFYGTYMCATNYCSDT
jgi:hypothetical protein